MTKFRVVFLVSLMTAISGCCNPHDPACDTALAGSKCIENVKKSAVPCVNNDDIKARLNEILEEMSDGKYFTCADYQRLYCREMLDGLKR